MLNTSIIKFHSFIKLNLVNESMNFIESSKIYSKNHQQKSRPVETILCLGREIDPCAWVNSGEHSHCEEIIGSLCTQWSNNLDQTWGVNKE